MSGSVDFEAIANGTFDDDDDLIDQEDDSGEFELPLSCFLM